MLRIGDRHVTVRITDPARPPPCAERKRVRGYSRPLLAERNPIATGERRTGRSAGQTIRRGISRNGEGLPQRCSRCADPDAALGATRTIAGATARSPKPITLTTVAPLRDRYRRARLRTDLR